MRFPLRFVFLAAMVALLASACSTADRAATVSDVEITDDQVFALSVQEEGASSIPATNPCLGVEVVDPEQACIGFSDDLTVLVFLEAMVQAAEADFGITGTGTDEVRAAYLGSAPPEADQLLQALTARPGRNTQGFEDVIIDQLDLRDRVRSALNHDEDNLVQLWQERPSPEIDYCVRHILVATEEEAVAVQTRLDAGEDFAVIASEVSLDTSSPGGLLPCPSDPARWVPSFSEAVAEMEPGDVSDPVETEFGWHIISVGPRNPTSYEILASDPDLWVPAEATDFWWSAWVDDAVARADITVRSQLGTWAGATEGIVPPPDSP